MADDTPREEKTEQPTPKRLEDARKKGQIARSKELNMAAVMIAASMAMIALRPQIGSSLTQLMRHGLSIDPALLADPHTMIGALSGAGLDIIGALAPVFAVLVIAAVLGGIAVGGWSFSPQSMAPNFGKLNPIKGIGRVFGVRGLVEVAKALAKAFLVGGCALGFLYFSAPELLNLARAPLAVAMHSAGSLVTTTFLVSSLSLILVVLIDVPFQMWNHKKQLRMTRKEVQDEMKETEGRPEVKSRIRSLQQEMANRRMLEDVPDADVIVTNPTHFAVALKYAEDGNQAPVVLAKGVDLMAERIRAIGKNHRITLFEAPPLARALYWTTDIGEEIPSQLYLAVAQVLTYVYRLKAASHNAAVAWPEKPVVQVDEELAAGPRQESRPTEH